MPFTSGAVIRHAFLLVMIAQYQGFKYRTVRYISGLYPSEIDRYMAITDIPRFKTLDSIQLNYHFLMLDKFTLCSDKPGQHDFNLLRKLVLPDGSILRAKLPGRPTRDCLFCDPARDGKRSIRKFV